ASFRVHRGAMTFTPETGPDPGAPAAPALMLVDRHARDAAEATTRIDANGASHAIVGGAVRAYTVAHVDADGKLVQECVHSSATAVDRVRETAKPAAAKEH